MASLEISEGQPYFPAAAALEVTLRCNMRCLHCGSSADGRPRQHEMGLGDWQKAVDELVLLGTEYFTISGGEPFVWEHWRELAKHIRNHGKTLSMISNGSRISDGDIGFLASIGMWNIALSLDGTEEHHDLIRRTPGSFAQAVDAIHRFKRTPIKLCATTSVNKINFGDLESLRTILAELEIDLWQVQIVNAFGRAGELRDELVIEPSQYAAVVEFIHESQRQRAAGRLPLAVMPADSIGYCHGIAAEIWGELEWRGCSAGRYVIGIQSDGDVVGCLSLQGRAFVAGNILERSLAEIWADDEAFAYNRKFCASDLKGPCQGCPSGEACRGGCLGIGFSTSGELHHNAYCYRHIAEGRTDGAKAL